MISSYYYYIFLIGISIVSSSRKTWIKLSDSLVPGPPAVKYQFPFIVSIQIRSNHLCNGVIVSPIWVVSTARPLYNLTESIDRYKAVAGILKLGEKTGKVQTGNIKRIVLHPYFHFQSNSPVMPNDISVVEIKNRFIFVDSVTNVYLPYKAEEFVGKATVAGWGVTRFNSSMASAILHYVDMTMITLRKCSSAISSLTFKNIILRNSVICAVPENPNEGFCSKDSGSLLLQKNILIGIVSWRPGDCVVYSKRAVPVVFTNINHYLSFIYQYVT